MKEDFFLATRYKAVLFVLKNTSLSPWVQGEGTLHGGAENEDGQWGSEMEAITCLSSVLTLNVNIIAPTAFKKKKKK